MKRKFARSWSSRKFSACPRGCSTTAICCCRLISNPSRSWGKTTTSPVLRASIRMEPVTFTCPGPDLGFFKLSTAHDPRPILVHEGVPGHYFQLCLGWHNPDPIRRHYYDSGANEGLGFYAEEMMLQAGFFDDNPHTRETIYSFMRLRALRVEVDVKLALGEFTLQQGADYLARTVPMDRATALDEAAMFSSTPGQGISYQIGKLQITQLLSDARRMQGKDFSMLQFNNFVWNNGNVPISLQRWELLQDASEVPDLLNWLKHPADLP